MNDPRRFESVTRDPGCSRNLLWRVQLAPGVDPELARRTLDGAGYTFERHLGGVMFFSGADQTEIVLVPRTGRVQIRLGYLLSYEERAPRARELGQAILRAFHP